MQNGSVTTCSGIFYDSGGEFSNYSDNESFILTICPDNAEGRTRLDFQEFLTQLNGDFMNIYDGDGTTAEIIGTYSGSESPGLVAAGFDNTSGCLTIEFISNNSGNVVGWSANISCTTPCQDITALIDSTTPVANTEGIIEVCTGDMISLNGSGIFEVDGTGASYNWDLGDGNIVSGESVNVSYNAPGVYLVNLNIRDANMDNFMDGCPNTNTVNQIIRVSGRPDFMGTQAADNTLCFGDTTTIEGVVTPLTLVYNCPPPESVVTFLPDGNGVAYSTSINVTCFEASQVLTDVSQIESICLNMEHSYLGDLDIEIISPNGQVVRLHDQGGGSANLGIPWATGTVDGNSANTTPGVGSDYCFVPNGGFPTLVGGIQGTIEFPEGDGPGAYTDSFVPAGSYSSINPLDGLIGSPLNGEWNIVIVDNLGADNGYIFSWELNFDEGLALEDYSYIPTIVSQSWDADPSITEINGNIITVAPQSAGEHCYVFRTVDEFGCEYAEDICVTMTAEGQPPTTFYEDLDGDGYGDPNITIEDCSNIPPFGYAINGLDCNDTNNGINPDATDSEGNGIDENCDGVDGDLLSIDDILVNDIKVITNPFNDSIVINIPSSLTGTPLSICIYDLNGRTVYENILIDSNGQLRIGNLNRLEKATYLLELSNKKLGLNVIKKLIKL
ncbi:PKD domain-containing protein [uncultured Winogradskyella sp.]|uniref:PKD domain-containing protein n=1 Tax=uncultured Winogradskyella sp. TaxID=395353 RepID=UPI00260DE4AF|nr:PKD domain-containing protein [uncultured Winogradskyella sp.]